MGATSNAEAGRAEETAGGRGMSDGAADGRARDEALVAVAERNLPWLDRALWLLRNMKESHPEATGEMMRLWLLKIGLSEPSSPHAWGSLTRVAAMRGIIEDTGRVMNMSTVKSHARRTPVWRFR